MRTPLQLLCASLLALPAFPSPPQEVDQAIPEREAPSPGPRDADLEAFRVELLDLAGQAALTLPIRPHIKNRSRELAAVAEACFDLDRPQQGLAFLEQIPNWRRGEGYAAYALYCARSGHPAQAQRFLAKAQEIADWPEDVIGQSWRRDRILVQIAQAQVALGEGESAAVTEASVEEPSETGKVDAIRASDGQADFEQLVSEVERVLGSQNFDLMRNALVVCANLYARDYADVERRDRVEKLIKDNWTTLPLDIRIDLMLQLVGFALDHEDQPKAIELMDEVYGMVMQYRLTPDYQVRYLSELAGLRHEVGQSEQAVQAARAARIYYDENRDGVMNIDRAQTLRPLAAAYHRMGKTEQALATFKLVVHEGYENPNVRPRAEDLSATCRTMALVGFEPDEELWDLMRHIQADNRANSGKFVERR